MVNAAFKMKNMELGGREKWIYFQNKKVLAMESFFLILSQDCHY
jgi:hypothetical protein